MTTTTIPENYTRDDRWRVERVLAARPFPEWDSPDQPRTHHVIVAKIALDKRRGNERAYFSTTADIYRVTSHGRHDEGGGAMTDEIARLWPKAALATRLHLSDDDGTPMHAIENGRYWLGLTRYDPHDVPGRTPNQVAADLLRITPAQVTELHTLLGPRAADQSEADYQRNRLDEWLEESGTRARWHTEAAEVRAFILDDTARV